MYYQSHTLENGLRIVHLPLLSPISYCGFAVNAGTRDESNHEFGLAHFVEHMIFKGTSHRRSLHILNRMENVGGELNAYTAKEETLIYSVFLEEHLGRAIELLSDLVLNSCFPQSEIEKEVEVILDEINSYRDNPSELIYDDFENLLFQNHQLGHNILGDKEDLLNFNSFSGQNFLDRFYCPGNMVFFSMGSTPFKKIVSLVSKNLGSVPGRTSFNKRFSPDDYTPFCKRESLDTFQTHVLIGNRAYTIYDKRRTALYLLNNILGGPGMNSRLNISLRERTGYVYTVESSLTSYTDTGVFVIYFGTDHKNTDKCIQLIQKELKKFRDKSLTSMQLSMAKKQLMGQIGVGTDNRESLALGLGKTFLHCNRYDSMDEIYLRLEMVTASDILAVANEIFDEKSLSMLIYD